MPFPQYPLITNDNFSPWGISIVNKTRENSFARSTDVSLESNAFGSYAGLRNDIKYPNPFMNYRGEYSPTASYAINDVVRVLPNKEYSLPWDAPPTEGMLSHEGEVEQPALTGNINGTSLVVLKFKPVAGVYVCVYPVPNPMYVFNLIKIFASSFNPGVGSYLPVEPVPLDTYPSWVQKGVNYVSFGNVNYYPCWPEMPNIAQLDGNNLYKLKGRYWELISLMPTQTFVCSNGVQTAEYTDTQTVPSGSANYVPPS